MFLRGILLLAITSRASALKLNALSVSLSTEPLPTAEQVLDDYLLSDCTMDVNLREKTINVKYSGGEFTISDKGMNGDDSTDSIIPEQKGLVCEVMNTGAKKDAMGIFTQATSSQYIFHNEEEEVWPGFANKLCYAKQHGYRFFMWFGNLPNSTLELMKNARDDDALPCADTNKMTTHYLRSVGMAKVLREQPEMPWLVQMDIQDQIIAPSHFDKDFDKEFLQTDSDIVGAAPHYGVFLNAGAIAFKNTPWARNFLMTWFKNRCGGKDQLSLWHSLFTEWKNEGQSNFAFEPEKMTNYKQGLPHALEAAGKFGEGGMPLQAYNQTHILDKEAKFPHLTILPNGGAGCKDKLCMRFSDSGEMPFFWSGSTCKLQGKTKEECDPQGQVCLKEENCNCW